MIKKKKKKQNDPYIEEECYKKKEEEIKKNEKHTKELLALAVIVYASVKKEVFNAYAGTPKWDYENMTKFGRLDGLVNKVSSNIFGFKGTQIDFITNVLKTNYIDAFNNSKTILSSVFIDKGLEVPGFTKISDTEVQVLLKNPWSGTTFEERISKNIDNLNFKIKETVTQSIMNGESLQDVTKRIETEFSKTYNSAKMIVETETDRMQYEGDIEACKQAKVKQVQYNATFDNTCPGCGSLHGTVYDLGTQPALPRHPRCKCYYEPYIEEELD